MLISVDFDVDFYVDSYVDFYGCLSIYLSIYLEHPSHIDGAVQPVAGLRHDTEQVLSKPRAFTRARATALTGDNAGHCVRNTPRTLYMPRSCILSRVCSDMPVFSFSQR